MKPQWLTVQEVAACKGVIPRRVRQWITSGRLPAERFGHQYLIRASDVHKFTPHPRGRPKHV